jgi:hypothetical protein
VEEAKNLSLILGVLDKSWKSLTANLTEEQFELLKTNLNGLESKLKSSDKTEQINEAAKNFTSVFNSIEPLNFLISPESVRTRSGSLPDIEEDIKIKLINCAIALQERINETKQDNPDK